VVQEAEVALKMKRRKMYTRTCVSQSWKAGLSTFCDMAVTRRGGLLLRGFIIL
jgi:hypothetical protein